MFDGNGAGAIGLFGDANESVPAPVLTTFDGVRLEGTSSVEGGSVEVYRVAALWSPVATATVSGGSWSVDLEEALERVAIAEGIDY